MLKDIDGLAILDLLFDFNKLVGPSYLNSKPLPAPSPAVEYVNLVLQTVRQEPFLNARKRNKSPYASPYQLRNERHYELA